MSDEPKQLPGVPGWYECRDRQEKGCYVRWFDGNYVRWNPESPGFDVVNYTDFRRLVPASEPAASEKGPTP